MLHSPILGTACARIGVNFFRRIFPPDCLPDLQGTETRVVAEHPAARQDERPAIPSRSCRHAKGGRPRPERFVDASTWRGLELLHWKDAAPPPPGASCRRPQKTDCFETGDESVLNRKTSERRGSSVPICFTGQAHLERLIAYNVAFGNTNDRPCQPGRV